MRAAIYARVSTLDQEPENQLRELRCHCDARGWQATAFWTGPEDAGTASRPRVEDKYWATKGRVVGKATEQRPRRPLLNAIAFHHAGIAGLHSFAPNGHPHLCQARADAVAQ